MKTQDVRTYTKQRLRWLQNLPDNQRRAELAKLRRGVGHRPGELPELWGSFLLGMPEGFQGNNGPTAAEWAGICVYRGSVHCNSYRSTASCG